MQQNLRGCSIVFIAAASPRALIPALFNRVIVEGDLVVVYYFTIKLYRRTYQSDLVDAVEALMMQPHARQYL